MPPKLDTSEKAIGARLRAAREAKMIPREKLAREAGVNAKTLASAEAGRTALRWGMYVQICAVLPINPDWLHSGLGAANNPFNAALLQSPVSHEARFSTAFADAAAIPADDSPAGIAIAKAEVALKAFQDATAGWMAMSPAARSKALQNPATRKAWERVMSVIKRGLERHEILERGGDPSIGRQRETALAHGGPDEKKALDDMSDIGHTDPVNITVQNWPELRATIARLLQAGRTRAALAKAAQTSPSRVSEWLSANAKPSAEKTILLLRWVQEQERSN